MENKKQKVSSKETASICNVFVVGVDGSEGSHNAVDLVCKDFHRRGLDKTIIVHISNTKKEHEKGIQYHSKTIYNHYSEYLQSHLQPSDYEIIFEERKEGSENVFEQINEIATGKDATLLVLGFRGYKGSKNRPDELSKSVTYLVHKPKIPVLVIKEKVSREFKVGGQFKWLICVESEESKSFKALKSMLRYVDAENDIIHAFTVDKKEIDTASHPIKIVFDDLMVKNDIKNYEFSSVVQEEDTDIKSTIMRWIEVHLQQENHYVDFVVLGYNPSKYTFQKDVANTTVDMLKEVNSNIYFDH